MQFRLQSDYKPSGDQPQAIKTLVNGIEKEHKHQVLLGITGSGKTFSMANVSSIFSAPLSLLRIIKHLLHSFIKNSSPFFLKMLLNILSVTMTTISLKHMFPAVTFI